MTKTYFENTFKMLDEVHRNTIATLSKYPPYNTVIKYWEDKLKLYQKKPVEDDWEEHITKTL